MDNFLIYEEIHKRDSCIVYRGRIKRTIDFVMIYCVDKYKRHELSNLVCPEEWIAHLYIIIVLECN